MESQIYVVTPGDTVASIAASFGVDAESITFANQLTQPYQLVNGQALLIVSKDSASELQSAENPIINVNGYAYPFISPWVLNQTLPYLTRLSIFSYGFTSEGELIPPRLPDEPLIEAALNNNTLPILTLTPFGPDGKFSNYLINQMINNPDSVRRLIDRLLQTMSEKGYSGTDIDFEYILAEDRNAFTAFVQSVTDALNAQGFSVSVALAPKTSANQPGLLYEGKDYPALGEAANTVLLMTYEWGYTYGPPMAVAPINKVRQVVDYAITEIPRSKIDLGIPNYGYDWPLPYVRGVTKARTIGNIEAIQIAKTFGADIQFDETAQSPYFRYTDNGTEHEVWFEDVRSMQAKFNLIKEYDLHGAGYWQIMQLFRANWLLLADNFNESGGTFAE